jgi:hypothetical protein
VTVTSYITVRGPLWDGEASAAVTRWLEETRKKVADEGVLMLRAFPMDKTGRARGGFEAAVHRVTDGDVETIPGPTDRGIVWTPWLEGTSRRNDSTRFAGYHLFRKTRTKLARVWRRDAQALLDRYIEDMGGHVG